MANTVKNKITDLKNRVASINKQAKQEFLPLEQAALNWKETADKWSVLECLEHLNYYNRYYNEAIAKALVINPENRSLDRIYKPGYLGKKFVNMVKPDTKKIKTMKRLNPESKSGLGISVLEEFIANQNELLMLLDKAKSTDIVRAKIPLEIFKLLKIRM